MEQEQRERQFIEQVGLFMENAGLTRMSGRLLGLLLICDPPEQSSAQLVARLSASKGSISTNTRMLLASGLIEKVAMPGERGSWFRVRPHAWEKILEQELLRITSFRELILEGLTILDGASEKHRQRLEEAHEFYGFMEQEFPLVLRRWQQRRRNS